MTVKIKAPGIEPGLISPRNNGMAMLDVRKAGEVTSCAFADLQIGDPCC